MGSTLLARAEEHLSEKSSSAYYVAVGDGRGPEEYP